MMPDDEKTWILSDENFLKLWRLVNRLDGEVDTLFSDYEKLKKMYRALKEYERHK